MIDRIILIPTYDEAENVGPIAKAIFEAAPDSHILFVDDSSPDGTGEIIARMCSEDDRIHLLTKPGKSGLGRAYISGFQWALKRDYKLIFGMDADLSHDPCEIPVMSGAARTVDMVIGSRYVGGIRITNWPLSRLLLSKMAATYVRVITGMPVHDPTGGYRCYRREALEGIPLDSILSNGYSFLVEMAYTIWINGFRIREVPITFEDRRAGYSKMSMGIFKESLWMVWNLAIRNHFRRTPRKRKAPIEDNV